tara:strand:+ start:75 stop:473 length:399 start_codon:yes stop_codon:yes gene_type:complete
MTEEFTVEIISPEKSLIKINTSEVTIPSYEGQMGILKNHIPLITFLRPGIVHIKHSKEKKYYVEEGTVEFSNNNLLILSSTANEISSIKKDTLNSLIIDAEKKLGGSEITDKEKYYLSYKIETLKEITEETF